MAPARKRRVSQGGGEAGPGSHGGRWGGRGGAGEGQRDPRGVSTDYEYRLGRQYRLSSQQ